MESVNVLRARAAHDLSFDTGPVSVLMAKGLYLIGRDAAVLRGMNFQTWVGHAILDAALREGLLKKEDSFLFPIYLDTTSA